MKEEAAFKSLPKNSLIPFLSGETNQIHSSEYVFGLEHNNLAMIRKGDWKITNIKRPFLEENFKLYNISQDLAELHDLKESEPEKYKELLEEWRLSRYQSHHLQEEVS